MKSRGYEQKSNDASTKRDCYSFAQKDVVVLRSGCERMAFRTRKRRMARRVHVVLSFFLFFLFEFEKMIPTIRFGDITRPVLNGNAPTIVNICNNSGVWRRKGLAKMLLDRYGQKVREEFRKECVARRARIGVVVTVHVSRNDILLSVTNIAARRGAVTFAGNDPFYYDALRDGLRHVFDNNDDVHISKTDIEESGGNWNVVYDILNNLMAEFANVNVTIYLQPRGM